jgi:hypothetical protein
VLDSQFASEYAILLSFGVVLDGTMLEAVTRSTTGINGSSEGIVAVLVASDTASALNVSLGSVQVLAVQQISSRQLLVNVSATVPVDAEAEAAAASTQDLSAGESGMYASSQAQAASSTSVPACEAPGACCQGIASGVSQLVIAAGSCVISLYPVRAGSLDALIC